MGDRFDVVDLIDESGWPYPDETSGALAPEPVDLRSAPDDDLVALHALRRPSSLSDAEWAAVAARFGLTGTSPLTMAELGTALGLSRDRTRVVLSGGLAKLRTALADDG
jgi:RNA polymerase primary sigma factor